MSIFKKFRQAVSRTVERLVRPRVYWEKRAAALRDKGGWFVGRTDLYSYLASDDGYVHYAYPPGDGACVQFRGSPASALRKAVLYADRANSEGESRAASARTLHPLVGHSE